MIKGTAKINQGLPFSLFHKVRSRVHSRLSEDCKIDRMRYPPVKLRVCDIINVLGSGRVEVPCTLCKHRSQQHFKILLISVLIWPNKILFLVFLEQNFPDL